MWHRALLWLLLKKQAKIRERGNQLFRRVVFPSPLNPHPFLAATGGIPRTPYVITRKLRSFAFSPDNAVNFFLRSSLTPTSVLAAFATFVCQRNCIFLCKGTKLKIVMPVFLWHRVLVYATPQDVSTHYR